MQHKKIVVLGGSGFVGRRVCHQLANAEKQVLIPTRQRDRSKDGLITLPTAEVVEADIHDEAQLARLLDGADAVINLVGILYEHGKRSGSEGFDGVHVELTRKVLAACEKAGIRRYLHMSTLGAATDGPSQYLRSKGEAEQRVAASKLDWTIFRPSLVVGSDDRFLTLFAGMLRWAPLMMLVRPNARFQPIAVEDVARCFAMALDLPATYGQRYELGGPRVYSFRELMQLIGEWSGHLRPIIGLPDGLAYLEAALFELLPVKLLSRDNLDSTKVDSVLSQPFPSLFGFTPAALETLAPHWLGKAAPRAKYDAFRAKAHR